MTKAIEQCRTQREAIKQATSTARSAAADNDCDWTEKVLMMCGDTLYVTSSPGGRVTKKRLAGWDSADGLLWCGPRVATKII